jgi:hypothetical protein
MTNLVFVFPSSSVGGVSTLFVRIVNYINTHHGSEYKAYIADFLSGYSYGLVEDKYRIIVEDSSLRMRVPDNSILWFQHSTNFRLFDNINGANLRCVFWNLHVNNSLVDIPILTNFIRKRPFSKAFRWFIKIPIVNYSYTDLTNYIARKGGLVFMENSVKQFLTMTSKSLNIKDCPRVPLYFPIFDKTINYSFNKKTGLSVLYLGRLVDFKVGPLVALMNDLVSLKLNKVNLFVIGDGPLKSLLKDHSHQLGLQTTFLDGLNQSDFKDVVNKYKINLGVAMGTSILELINTGIPVFGVNINYKLDSKSSYIHFEDFNENLAKYEKFDENSYSLDGLLSETGIKSTTSLYRTYGPDAILKLLKASERTSLKYAELIPKFKRFKKLYKTYYAIRAKF